MMEMQDEDLPICVACGSQFDCTEAGQTPLRCKICDDPRQFVPPSGQAWTTLSKLREDHRNEWTQDERDSRIWSFWTEPKFAIGQRASILSTSQGLILWDLIALIDEATIAKIKSLGDLKAIVISHPHYYTTCATWSVAFGGVPVFIAEEDEKWLCRSPPSHARVEVLKGAVGTKTQVLQGSGVVAVKVGGHFPGSLVLAWEEVKGLWIADSIVTVPSAGTPHPRPKGQTTYSFMWSIPNMIPMTPDEIMGIWMAVKDLDFEASYGAFNGMNVRDKDLKSRLLQSMQTQIDSGGWTDRAIMKEECPGSVRWVLGREAVRDGQNKVV